MILTMAYLLLIASLRVLFSAGYIYTPRPGVFHPINPLNYREKYAHIAVHAYSYQEPADVPDPGPDHRAVG